MGSFQRVTRMTQNFSQHHDSNTPNNGQQDNLPGALEDMLDDFMGINGAVVDPMPEAEEALKSDAFENYEEEDGGA